MYPAFQAALVFFISTLAELLLLFVAISALVQWLQLRFPAARVKALLGGGAGYLTAAALGAITPFCSCSTLPLLEGMLRARADFGPVMTFLLTSPLLNPVLLVLLIGTLGLKLALFYALGVLLLALLAGWLLQHLGFGRYVTLTPGTVEEAATSVATQGIKAGMLLRGAVKQTREVLPHLIAGVAVGALIHGYVPADFFSRLAFGEPWWLIPASALLGIPLYVRASSMLPLAASLVSKGVSYGSVMALTIGGAGASLPELIILSRLFRWPLLLAFITVVFTTACVTGLTVNLLMQP
ncbi:permease [Shewanella cyperi]|uniref:permease n=1 Tax=Shewanella cyperi TaxID=2814292 RepID=UPI001A943821|nr:permease [Shewanella cyperi]QSX40947.1 permease [Shewanella cyperi]